MRILTLLFLLPAACGTYPQFVARRTLQFEVPAAEIRGLSCTSHNGGVEVRGEPGRTAIAVAVTLSVRGQTQEEADANLQRLDVARETKDGVLSLAGVQPEGLPMHCSPSFGFVVTAPRQIAVVAKSHNGSIEVVGTAGELDLLTHNGEVTADAHSGKVAIVSYNGDVTVTARGAEPVHGSIETHNGSIELAIPEGAGAKVAAATHNGSIEVAAPARLVEGGKRSAEAVYGDGRGALRATTHNGDVTLR